MVASSAQKTKAAQHTIERAAHVAIDRARESAQAGDTGAFKPERFLEPDFVDQVFDYLLSEFPHLFAGADAVAVKLSVRRELGGRDPGWVRRHEQHRRSLGSQALALFNGRNATEVARRLKISRATVYRLLKQAAKG